VASIINGLFAGRSGIASHGTAIAVVGDNISNASTIAYKSSRAEFEDFIAGGQTAGQTVGSGSSTSAVTTIFQQGTMESTGRALDLGVDGNGFFVVADGAQRFFTRAGNFKVNNAGFIVDQNNFSVLGFPANGTKVLQPININSVAQDSVATTSMSISGNVDSTAAVVDMAAFDAANPVANAGTAPTLAQDTTYAQLSDQAEFSTVVRVFDSLGAAHNVTFFFFRSDDSEYTARAYVNSEEVDPTNPEVGRPRFIGEEVMTFGTDGLRSDAPASGIPDFSSTVPWNNGSSNGGFDVTFDPFTQFAASSSIASINQDGKGVGAVTSINVDQDGKIFALLDNGQRSVLATVGLVNFANTEGLNRVGKNLLQQSTSSGEPIVGEPTTGQFGAVKSGSLELSTVDIASEFVRLIQLQRGFQANSRIITTINGLLNDIIQLV
jgi:flagellar hook protein FlgE